MALSFPAERLKGVFESRLLSLVLLVALGLITFSNPNRIHRWGVVLMAFILYPAAQRISNTAAKKWRSPYTLLSMAVACAAFAAFIVMAGNHQFAAFDCSLLVDIGWRLIQGQVPYRDFICTLPPAFIVAVKYAYQLFGVQWNAILYLDAIFASISFLWIYGLLSGLLRHKLAAFSVALSVECAGVLPISYWWHNSIASVTATIFMLSCLSYLRLPNSLATQASYVTALSLLCLMKPNTALPLAAGGIFLVFLATPTKVRFTLLTVLSAGLVLLILILNNVSPAGLVSSYRAVAAARGISAFGFSFLGPADRMRTALYVSALLAPGLLRWWGSWRAAVRSRDIPALCGHLLLLLGPMVGTFAMFTNGEMKDTDFPLLICFSAVLLWGKQYEPRPGPDAPKAQSRLGSIVAAISLRRLYASFLFGLAISELFLGMARQRIEFAEHEFFEFTDSNHNPGVPYFRSMRASPQLNRVLTQAAEAVRDNPGPLFFGPHFEFGYAALGVPSPLHLPIWWHDGTSYAVADETSIVEAWRRSGFATLIFLRTCPMGPPMILEMIRERYVRDDRWPELIVFRAKPAGQVAAANAGGT